jgi:alanine dehydrogenase
MREIYLTYLNRADVEAAALSDAEILATIEGSLAMQGRGETVIEPRTHLEPRSGVAGHFNVLRGWIGGGPSDGPSGGPSGGPGVAGVKVIGDFVENYRQDLPSELGLLCLFDPRTGAPTAVLDASGITDIRTGAVTAVGAKYLARRDARTLGHIGARGTAYWNVRLLDSLFGFETIRVHSRRPDSRGDFARRLSRDLGKEVIATADWRSCVEGADIVVEASRLAAPQPLLRTEWIKPGSLVIPYGTMSAVELSLTDIMSKIVVDDWGQCASGKFGALRAHVEAGKLTQAVLHAELGQIVAGLRPGREDESETILFWHRGLSLSDIALGQAILAKAAALGVGQRLRYA